ncbi:hypothetical protein DFH09DRAFT_1100666 [Mycena vulgaris]|nr:hypothetical protein DFH09DRAFT_1100666 [Mycena vulgaris]
MRRPLGIAFPQAGRETLKGKAREKERRRRPRQEEDIIRDRTLVTPFSLHCIGAYYHPLRPQTALESSEPTFITPNWEPEENLLGSKWALKIFWKRADLNGRNYKNISGFKKGEVIQLASPEVLAKMSGCGRSSAPLVAVTRVFAVARDQPLLFLRCPAASEGDKYIARFDEDDSEVPVLLKHIRTCEHLRATDTIILKSDAASISKLKVDGSFTVKKELKVDDIAISAWCIENEWWDRRLSHEHICFCRAGKTLLRIDNTMLIECVPQGPVRRQELSIRISATGLQTAHECTMSRTRRNSLDIRI